MYLLLDVDVPNFNLCCLLITQCSQNGRVTFVSPWSNFWSERIFKPFSDIWLIFYATSSSSFLKDWLMQLTPLPHDVFLSLTQTSLQLSFLPLKPSTLFWWFSWFHCLFESYSQDYQIVPRIKFSSLHLSHVILLK